MVTKADVLIDRFKAWWVASGGPPCKAFRGFGDNILVGPETFDRWTNYDLIEGKTEAEERVYIQELHTARDHKIRAHFEKLGMKVSRSGSMHLVKRLQWGK